MFNNARKYTMLKKGQALLQLMTGWEYYGKALKPEMLKTKHKNGTAISFVYDTAQVGNQAEHTFVYTLLTLISRTQSI